MKRLFTAALALVLILLYIPATLAAEPSQSLWSRHEGAGDYVTIRIPCPEEWTMLNWSEWQNLAVRYRDTQQPVPLTSRYLQGYLFATVPASKAEQPLEVFKGEQHRFPDLIQVWDNEEYYTAPSGADELYLRGVLQGDEAGNLNAAEVVTRAEAFTLICRLLSLEPAGNPEYQDVPQEAWYYDIASAARAAGITAEDKYFQPERPVLRGEVMTMVARAMTMIGWLDNSTETSSQLELVDGQELPQWAVAAYQALLPWGVGIVTYRETGEIDPDGFQTEEMLVQWDQVVTREELITVLNDALRLLPVYPNELALQWGLDQEVPVIDGSTSTRPYTQALYGMLFEHYEKHPQYPETHSKSHESYERLINGEVDLLFAATKASAELEAKAKAAGVELEYIPMAYDAIVFFTNRENTVTGLTQKQIQEIYVENQYDNWNQVGGPDSELLPYRRNTDSGSHALMEQYFLEGGKLSLSPDVYNVYTSYAMTSALTDVAQALRKDPPAYAIGYSVYYYYLNSYWLLGDAGGGELKLLAVDGVVPTEQTIADGSYPLAGYNYVVLRADEPADSSARIIADFMLSPAGQQCVANAGFGRLVSEIAETSLH